VERGAGGESIGPREINGIREQTVDEKKNSTVSKNFDVGIPNSQTCPPKPWYRRALDSWHAKEQHAPFFSQLIPQVSLHST